MHPLRSWDDVLQNHLPLLKRIHSRFEHRPGRDRSQYFYAPLAIRWMRGEPLRRLIENAEDYNKKHNIRKGIATLIREMMACVESDLRFRYVKYISCYSDILALVLQETHNEELVQSIAPLPLFLELGASSAAMISFISLGLSRTTASLVAELSVDKSLDRQRAERFLKRRDWDASSLPLVVIEEVKGLVSTLPN